MLMRVEAERMAGVGPDDFQAMSRSNIEFHRSVWRASHNDALTDLLERLSLHLERFRETTLAYEGRLSHALDEHHQILAAIERRDAETAAQLATEHFTSARDIRLKQWAASQSGRP
jgi:DNA-binding GntR family transcriptional regulator